MSEAVNRRINAVLVKKDGEVMAICTRCHEANPNREQVHSAECKVKGEDGNFYCMECGRMIATGHGTA